VKRKEIVGPLIVAIGLLAAGCATGRYGATELDAWDAVARGEGREALAYYESRAPVLELGGLLNRAEATRTYGAAALVAQYLGAYQKAIHHAQRAMEILDGFPGWVDVSDGRMSVCLVLGFTYSQVGDLATARRQFDTCLQYAGRLTARLWLASWSSVVWTGLSTVAYLEGDHARAIGDGKTAVGLREDALAWLEANQAWRGYHAARERNLRAYALTLIILGRAEFELKHLDDADRSLRRAVETAWRVGAREFEVIGRASLADVAYARGDFAGAEREGRETLVQSRRLGLSFFTTFILSRVGIKAAERGRHEDALGAYREAMETVEDARSQLEEVALRTLFVEDKQAIYHGAVLSALALGRTEEAFGFAERGRARALLDLLGTQTILARGKIGAGDEEEGRVRARLTEIRTSTQGTTTVAALASGSGLRSGADPVRDIAIGEYRALVERVRREDIERASLMTVEPVTVAEVQSQLPPDTTLLEYLVTERETILWVVDRASVEIVRVPVPRVALVAEVRALREAIAERRPLEDVQRRAAGLYARLVESARPYLRSNRLLIVPHDVLHYVPFAALRSGEGRWLVEDYTLSTIPSASVLKYLAAKGVGASARALVVGNPDAGPGLDLPYAEREARAVADLYPEATVLLRQDATESRVKALSGTAGLLHFATHGELREHDPLASALLMAPDDREDGRLEVREIFRLALQARLVVLSACETGLGRLSKGDELVGLQRAFLYAGTPAVVTTLWKVEDRASYFLDGIAGRDLARQVVVDGPGETGAGDAETRPREPHALRRAPGQHDRADGDGRHAGRDPTIDVLAEDEPGEQRREDALQVQEERAVRGRAPREPEHEQHRPNDSAGQDRGAEPRPVPARQGRLVRPVPRHRSPSGQEQPERDPGPEVQKSREEPGIGHAYQRLRRRRAQSEQEGGGKRQRDGDAAVGEVGGTHLHGSVRGSRASRACGAQINGTARSAGGHQSLIASRALRGPSKLKFPSISHRKCQEIGRKSIGCASA
jgi:CHAT domain-containing protein/tetratricopeptide (TPR) repeat protein